MLDPETERPLDTGVRQLRQFAGGCCLVLVGFGVAGLLRGHPLRGAVFLALATVVGALGLFRPQALLAPFVLLTYLALPVGLVVSRLVLGLLYFGLFTPVALGFRLIRRDALMLRRRERNTYWLPYPSPDDVRRYFR